jgi:hypothetical protein
MTTTVLRASLGVQNQQVVQMEISFLTIGKGISLRVKNLARKINFRDLGQFPTTNGNVKWDCHAYTDSQ